MSKILTTLAKAAGPNTCQYIAKTANRGDFLIQVAWPLAWSEEGVPPSDDPAPQTLYVGSMVSLRGMSNEILQRTRRW